MKKSTKFLSVILAAVMLTAPLTLGASAAVKPYYDIKNPYASVDFSKWQPYKAQLHCHTTASDGYLTVDEVVQKHYNYDYDILAITDHGTLNRGWNVVPQTIPILRIVKSERTNNAAPVIPLTDDRYNSFLDGTAKTTDGYSRTSGNGMIDVPLGIELNAATPVCDCHLTGYFSEYGQGFIGVYGDYETPSKGVKEAGGISMLSHIGEYVYKDKDSADHVGQPVDEYYVNKFARLFLDNAGSSVGMGINSATDAHTRCDRILYDSILKKTIPYGVVPWAFSFSDSHNDTSINDAYTIHYMPELNNDELRRSMENGTVFAVSHYSNGYELNGMQELPGYNDDPDTMEWDKNTTPLVTNVVVDDEEDTISIEGENFNQITWVADGEVLKREDIKDGKASIDLNDYDFDYFVRFYITGDNGICYSQPFVVNKDGKTHNTVTVPETRDLPYVLRSLVDFLDKLIFSNSVFIAVFKYVVLGYVAN